MQVIEQPTRNDTLTCNDTFKRPYYLPHHAVFKQTSSTTKLRVVFDASAKADNGISLNDTLIVDPSVQQDLISIVLRFRTHVYAMIADIAKMYRQVLVDPRDYDLQRIIWRNSSEEEIGHYQLKTITYGSASAPFLATRCIIQLANENSKQFPKASEVIRRDFYVDDLQTGADDLTEAMQLQGEITAILKQAGFDLRKWCSNSSTLLESVSETDDSNHTFNFSSEGINTLGLIWNHIQDKISIGHNIFNIRPPWSIRSNYYAI
ncbi:uncharacterized protein LOC142317594 [Lycorma delicatula]|uniref:uncharacterized protein LOC142317594 n=1 Tax=Lycorma delicatula TaxID=130591 RepID=UPI003F5109A6